MQMKDAEQERISSAAAVFGKKGGSARGPRKARTPDHYVRISKLAHASRKRNAKKRGIV
jgi:hypothetical protein